MVDDVALEAAGDGAVEVEDDVRPAPRLLLLLPVFPVGDLEEAAPLSFLVILGILFGNAR